MTPTGEQNEEKDTIDVEIKIAGSSLTLNAEPMPAYRFIEAGIVHITPDKILYPTMTPNGFLLVLRLVNLSDKQAKGSPDRSGKLGGISILRKTNLLKSMSQEKHLSLMRP